MPAIQEILGHADIGTTSQYIRVQSKDVDEAHALLEAHLILAEAKRKGPQRATPARAQSATRKKASG